MRNYTLNKGVLIVYQYLDINFTAIAAISPAMPITQISVATPAK